MNSYERASLTFKKQKADRPPLGFFAIDSDTASKVLGRPTFWRAKAASQIALWEGRRDEVVQSWIADGIELHKKLDIIDIISVNSYCAGICPPKNYDPNPPRKIDDVTWEDKEGRVYRYSELTDDIKIISDPTIWSNSYKLEDELWDGKLVAPNESIFEAVDALIEAFKDTKFVLGPAGYDEAWLLLGGMERGLMEIAQRPDEVKQIYTSRVERRIAENKFYVRPGQHGVLWGTDVCGTNGPLLNPTLYRDLFFDGFKQRIDSFKTLGQTVIKHACGNTWRLLDTFAEAGIDCYQSIQPSAGMDIVEIQKKYHDKFALWGGVASEHLTNGTTVDIRRDVDRFMQEAAPNGGVILGPSHSVVTGTKYENFMAMLDQFNKYI